MIYRMNRLIHPKYHRSTCGIVGYVEVIVESARDSTAAIVLLYVTPAAPGTGAIVVTPDTGTTAGSTFSTTSRTREQSSSLPIRARRSPPQPRRSPLPRRSLPLPPRAPASPVRDHGRFSTARRFTGGPTTGGLSDGNIGDSTATGLTGAGGGVPGTTGLAGVRPVGGTAGITMGSIAARR